MKTITYTKDLYKFEELSAEAKQNAINAYELDYEWWDGCYEMWQEKLEALGYDDVKINFSGFWSSGDGASFTGRVNVEKWIEVNEPVKYKRILKLLKADAIEVSSNKIVRDRWTNYVHWNTTSLYLSFEMYGRAGTSSLRVVSLIDELEQDIFSQYQSLNKEIYSSLEKEYDFLKSEECFKKTAEDNEWWFDVDGKLTN
jgi:hypothetical protein